MSAPADLRSAMPASPAALRRWLAQPMSAMRDRWDAPDEPPWRLLPWMLLIGFALRFALALSSDYAWRVDETIQYLEQAHRIVFGYGFVPWEIEVDARTWLIVGLPMAVLQACALLGLDHPDFYIPIMRTVNAAVSMAVPVGAYVLGRRMYSEGAGRAACVFACFWHELIAFAPHTLSELYSSYLLFGSLALLQRRMGIARSLAGGLLLSLAVGMRPPHAMAAGVFGIALLLLPLGSRTKLAGVAGAVLGAMAWGLVDLLASGSWFGSLFNYLAYADDFVRETGRETVLPYSKLAWPSFGLALPAVVWCALRARALFPLSLALLLVLAFLLSFALARPYSGYALAIMLGGTGTAVLWAHAGASLVAPGEALLKKLLPLAFACASVFALLGLLPGHLHTELQHSGYFGKTNPEIELFRLLSREPVGAVRAIWYDDDSAMVTFAAGYYHLHQEVVVYFPVRKWLAWLEAPSLQLRPPAHASHVITGVPACFPEFELQASSGRLSMLRRSGGSGPAAESDRQAADFADERPPSMPDTAGLHERLRSDCVYSRPRAWFPPRAYEPDRAPPDPQSYFRDNGPREIWSHPNSAAQPAPSD